jgi:PhzF family phenazine biosynthesis protein
MTETLQAPLYQVDAFTSAAFAGNPAAVLLLDEALSDDSMQRIAQEMNLSETAFVLPEDQNGRRPLRWFTPVVEVPLCGHATLATAHVLFSTGSPSPLRFQTASGLLTVQLEADGSVRMDFPADPPDEIPVPEGLLAALGYAGPASAHRGGMVLVLRVPEQADVEGMQPEMTALARVDLKGPLGVSVTAPGEGSVDFVSRFFGPWVGVDEDPVTGVAHTTLGPYWARETGRSLFKARQLSKRGGEVRVRVSGGRVHLAGHAVTVMEGTLLLP